MEFLFGLSFVVLEGLAALLLVACWQHTRIRGFLWLAAAYVLGILWRWLLPLLYSFADAGDPAALHQVFLAGQGAYLLIAGVGLVGLWGIYQGLRRRPAAPAA